MSDTEWYVIVVIVTLVVGLALGIGGMRDE